MTIGKPPFLLDCFAAYTEEGVERFGFTVEVLARARAALVGCVGDRWPAVAELRYYFRRQTGLTLLDLSLNNIRFE